jgi:hypothetical protein
MVVRQGNCAILRTARAAIDLTAFQRAAAPAAADPLTNLPRDPAIGTVVASAVAGSAAPNICGDDPIAFESASALNAPNTPPELADGSESVIGESRS